MDAYQAIANIISEESGEGTVVDIQPDHGYIDVTGKVGKESFNPILEETGYVVSATTGESDELGAEETRLWFMPVEAIPLED